MKIVFNEETKVFSINKSIPDEITLNIWGRKFKLKVIPQLYKDEKPEDFPVMIEAIKNFQKQGTGLLDKCKKDVEDMCIRENNEQSDTKISKVDNIFKYIMPVDVIISYDSHFPDHRLVSLSCNFKFDPEHGRYICFDNEMYRGCDNLDFLG